MTTLRPVHAIPVQPAQCGPRLYLEVLRHVKLGAGTDSQILKRLKGVKELRSVARITQGLWALGLIHPARWDRAAHSHYWQAAWRLGDDPAPPHPELGSIRPERCTAIELLAFAHWWTALQVPTSMVDLQEASGFGAATCRKLLAHARALKMVRVAAWDTSRLQGDYSPLYQRGGGADEPKPAARSTRELARGQYRRRVQRDAALALHAAVTGADATSLKFSNAGTPA